ncbi:hypothetical protein AK830_g6071 [Neonectria ditissima]|uniref:Uncharacterized protein n=1 Tax=Neonectria ditissima TaxID=78410 RepID=A0A0N8H716_9HYPO|nr:hypothetical protein AK830_g6071 [Neonectria ditissima]
MDPTTSVSQSLVLVPTVPVLPNVRPDMRELGDNWTGRRIKTQHHLPPGDVDADSTATTLFEGCALLTCPTRIAQVRDLMRQAYEDYTLRIPRPAALHVLVRLNVLTALARNAALLGFPPEGLCRDDFISPHNTRGSRIAGQPGADTACPGPLQPTDLQKTVLHHPWIDLFPFPPFRDNVLMGMAAGLVDDDELCADILEVQDEDLASKPSLIVWGKSSDAMSWEANPSFFRKWGFLVRGCPEIVEATNYWRAKRGETNVIFETHEDPRPISELMHVDDLPFPSVCPLTPVLDQILVYKKNSHNAGESDSSQIETDQHQTNTQHTQ